MPAVTVVSMLMLFVLVGSASSRSLDIRLCRRTFCTSTTGLAPLTVIVSATAPTRSSASTFAVKPAVNVMPSRTTWPKPARLNVTEYTPGRSWVML
jgi:hypothetical protein